MDRKGKKGGSLWPVIVERDDDGYFAYCPLLQGCYTQGETYEEAIDNLRDAIRLHVEDRIAAHEPLPNIQTLSLTAVEVPI